MFRCFVCGRGHLCFTMSHPAFLNLVGVLEEYSRSLVSRIARDYDLKECDLVDRYVVPDFCGAPESLSPTSLRRYHSAAPSLVAAATTPKRGRKRAPGVESLDLTRPQTEEDIRGLTIPSLKELCKIKGLKITGSRPELIARFLSWQENPDQDDLKPKKGGRKKQRSKVPETSHNHPLDGEHHGDCPECDAHGNPMAATQQEFEIAPVADLDAIIDAMDSLAVESAPQPVEDLPAPQPVEEPQQPQQQSQNDILKAQLAAILGGKDECESEEEECGDYEDPESSDGEMEMEDYE